MYRTIFFLIIFLLCSCANHSPQNANAAAINTQLGLAYLQHGDVARAKSKLLLAETEDPQSAVVCDALGYFFEKTGDLNNARKYYLKAITIATHKGSAYNNYGTFLYRQKHYREALKYFNLAAHDPTYLHADLAQKNSELTRKKF